jgi:hypothetical protein
MSEDDFQNPGTDSLDIPELVKRLKEGNVFQRQLAASQLWDRALAGQIREVVNSGALANMVWVGSKGRWELDEEGVRELKAMEEEEALEVLEQMMDVKPPRDAFRELLEGPIADAWTTGGSRPREEGAAKENEENEKDKGSGRGRTEEASDYLEEEVSLDNMKKRDHPSSQEKSPDLNKSK